VAPRTRTVGLGAFIWGNLRCPAASSRRSEQNRIADLRRSAMRLRMP